MLFSERYVLADKELRELLGEYPLELRDIAPDMVQPNGIFIPSVPLLEPPQGSETKWTVMTESWYITPDGFVIHMSVGDKTDLASTPRIAKLIFGGPGRETGPAVVHDELYSQPEKQRYNIFTHELWTPTQKWSDGVFLHGMKLTKTHKIKQKVYYRALRMLGFVAWNGYRRGLK